MGKNKRIIFGRSTKTRLSDSSGKTAGSGKSNGSDEANLGKMSPSGKGSKKVDKHDAAPKSENVVHDNFDANASGKTKLERKRMKEKAKQISDNNRSLKRKKKKNVVKQMLSGFQHSKDTSNVAADDKENLPRTPEQPTIPHGQLRMSKRGIRNGLAIEDKQNKQREEYPTLNGIQVGEVQNDETNSEEKLAKEEIYESRKLLIRQMQGMIAKSQHKNNRQSAKKRNTKTKGGEVVSEYDSWSDLEENFAKGYI